MCGACEEKEETREDKTWEEQEGFPLPHTKHLPKVVQVLRVLSWWAARHLVELHAEHERLGLKERDEGATKGRIVE